MEIEYDSERDRFYVTLFNECGTWGLEPIELALLIEKAQEAVKKRDAVII